MTSTMKKSNFFKIMGGNMERNPIYRIFFAKIPVFQDFSPNYGIKIIHIL